MDAELKSLRIDRNARRQPEPSRWATRWIVIGVSFFAVAGLARVAYTKLTASTPVETIIVRAAAADAPGGGAATVLNATGYIVAHHKIEVAAKVIGRVLWIGVEKGDRVREGQVIARLEDDEYRASVQQARGQLSNLQARLDQALHGSRPEEIEAARSNLEQAKADQGNAGQTLQRTRGLVAEGVLSRQALDDAVARFDGAVAKTNSLMKTYELAKLGPRSEEIASLRGQVEQAKGQVAYAQTQLDNTVIKAPVTGTILERAVEKGEFITTSFVGDRGAKGFVVSMADLNDLQVELDIAQNDFSKLHRKQRATVTTDAFRDLKYAGEIFEMSPEANRQKATVQVKVKILHPDDHLRPEMNANVAFLADDQPVTSRRGPSSPVILIPPAAVRGDAVFVVLGGRAVKRAVKTGARLDEGVQIREGLIGGEELIVDPPADLKEGSRVAARKS